MSHSKSARGVSVSSRDLADGRVSAPEPSEPSKRADLTVLDWPGSEAAGRLVGERRSPSAVCLPGARYGDGPDSASARATSRLVSGSLYGLKLSAREKAETGTGTATRDAREETPSNVGVHAPISHAASNRADTSSAMPKKEEL